MELSELSVQIAQSELIYLNTVAISDFKGISSTPPRANHQYIGYQVVTGDLVNANWTLRIRNVRKLLAIAGSLSTSVAVRKMLLNAIMLPAVLFTTAVFRQDLSCITCRGNFCGSTPRLPTVADTKSIQACCTRREERME